jgi:2-hydroxy-4-carboxymuconate semialdehyde hemiacetal dehydrogenase
LSFNNKGPQGTFFRYIGDTGTYVAYYDDLVDGEQNKIDLSKVDVSMNGIELQDREFFAAIQEKREPNAAVRDTISAMRVLDRLERMLGSKVGAPA